MILTDMHNQKQSFESGNNSGRFKSYLTPVLAAVVVSTLILFNIVNICLTQRCLSELNSYNENVPKAEALMYLLTRRIEKADDNSEIPGKIIKPEEGPKDISGTPTPFPEGENKPDSFRGIKDVCLNIASEVINRNKETIRKYFEDESININVDVKRHFENIDFFGMLKNISDAQLKRMDKADFGIPDLISKMTLNITDTINQMTANDLCSEMELNSEIKMATEKVNTFPQLFIRCTPGQDCKQRRDPSPAKPCFKVFKTRTNWTNAQDSCKDNGGFLAEATSLEILESITEIGRQSMYSLWIGGTDIVTEGDWIWATSGTRVQYSNWMEGEPNNYQAGQAENCLQVLGWKTTGVAINSGQWNDNWCKRKMYYICQRSGDSCADTDWV